MFNFNLMNRALKDSTLSDKAFRMLISIINYCSLKDSNSVEIHNAHFMMILNISERWVRKTTNELVEKGYITKVINGTSQNKLANTYTLIDTDIKDDKIGILNNKPETDTQKVDQNVPLKNNNKINNKNIHVNIHEDINTGNNKPEVINKNKFIKHDVNNINTGNSDERGNISVHKSSPLKINKNNKLFLSNTTGIYTGTNINTGYNTTEEINNLKPEVNNKTYINSDINKNKFIKHDVNNINVNNSDDPTKDLRIKNNLNTSIKNTMNTPTLEEILENQALDDQQVFNTTGNSENIGNKYSQEDQERYTRLFNKCKSQIEIWVKKHDYSCISMFDAYFKAIQDMNNENLISVKQWDAAQRCLFQRFMNLRNGYDNFIQNKKKHISSNEVNECNIPPTPTQIIDKINATA